VISTLLSKVNGLSRSHAVHVDVKSGNILETVLDKDVELLIVPTASFYFSLSREKCSNVFQWSVHHVINEI